MELQNWNWFALNFQWIGLGFVIILLVLLFCTSLLRANRSISRWKDYAWLSWLGMCAYLLHNVEEYGIDILGRFHGFPIQISEMIQSMFPAGAVPQSSYYLAVNITLFWIMAPIAALLSKRFPFAGLSVYAIIFINIFFHIMPLFAGVGYSSGTLTAIVIFIPLSVWVITKCFGKGKLNRKGVYYLFAVGVLYHIILSGSCFVYGAGHIGSTGVALVQILNTVMLFGLCLLGERWFNKKIVQL